MTEKIRSRLMTMREDIVSISAIGADSARPVKLDQSSVGRLSRMDAMQRQAIAQATQARRVEALGLIKNALIRLDQGEYGLCLACDEPINPKRLEVDPTAPLCVSCAEKEQ